MTKKREAPLALVKDEDEYRAQVKRHVDRIVATVGKLQRAGLSQYDIETLLINNANRTRITGISKKFRESPVTRTDVRRVLIAARELWDSMMKNQKST